MQNQIQAVRYYVYFLPTSQITSLQHRYMMNKSLALLLIAFAITADFCLAQENAFAQTSQNQKEPALPNYIVPLDLTKNGYEVTLSGSNQEIQLEKDQHLIVSINGNSVSHYKLVYSEPCDYMGEPSIYYTLKNPWTENGWYNSLSWTEVLKEQPKLNTTSHNSMSLHFLASNVGTEKIDVYVFDDTGVMKTNPAYSTSYDYVASFTLTVTVK